MYSNGGTITTSLHAKPDIKTLSNVVTTQNNFLSGLYVKLYRVSPDSQGTTTSVALEITLSDDSTFTCGNMKDDEAVTQTQYEIGDCEVITIGFVSGWVTSDPPYLVSLEPYITPYDTYTDAQKTEFTTPVSIKWTDFNT